MYYLIRRPTHILDFSLTLTFIHLILASYHSKSFPTSMFFWVVMSTGAIMMVVVAEQVSDTTFTLRIELITAMRQARDANRVGSRVERRQLTWRRDRTWSSRAVNSIKRLIYDALATSISFGHTYLHRLTVQRAADTCRLLIAWHDE